MKKYSIETTVGVFIVAGLICVGYMTVKLGNVSLFGGTITQTSVPADIEDLIGKYAFGDVKKPPAEGGGQQPAK